MTTQRPPEWIAALLHINDIWNQKFGFVSYPNIIEIPRNCAGNHGVSTFQSCEPLPSFLSYQFWKTIFQVSPFKHFSLRSTTCRGRNVDQLPTMEIYKGQELKQRWSGANTKKLQPQHPMIGTSGSSGGAVPQKRSYFLGDSMIFLVHRPYIWYLQSIGSWNGNQMLSVLIHNHHVWILSNDKSWLDILEASPNVEIQPLPRWKLRQTAKKTVAENDFHERKGTVRFHGRFQGYAVHLLLLPAVLRFRERLESEIDDVD